MKLGGKKEVCLMRLFPKEENFFAYFEELANKIEEGGQLFLEMTEKRDYSEAKVAKHTELMKKCIRRFLLPSIVKIFML
jgi:hypothetical protein